MKRWVDYIWVGCGWLIVDTNNRILLIKRTNKTQGGGWWFWSRPGGTVEFWETIEDAVIREIKEELNIDVELFGPKFYANDIRKEDWILKHWFTWGRFARIIWGKLTNMEPEKHDAVEWFSLDQLPEHINEYTKQSIEEYKAYITLFC